MTFRPILIRLLGIRLLGALFLPGIALAQFPVTCSTQTQAQVSIRNEGRTEQIGDYVFSCTNTGTSPAAATVQVTASPVPITSKVLNTSSGTSEAALIVRDSTGQQPMQTFLGTLSGGTVTFPNVPIPVSSNTSNYQPFVMEVTNIRVDATSLTPGATVSEAVSISGAQVSPASFPAAPIATVQTALGPQSTSGVVNFPVCSSITAAAAAFNVKFGENVLDPLAFKTQGGSGNTGIGSWYANNTETGYYVGAAVGTTVVTNTANSGTRLRVVFSNIPNNVSVYVPLTAATDQSITAGAPAGFLSLTTSEAGAYSGASASPNPPGYTGTSQLSALTVVNGTAEAVYEVVADSINTVESYTVPVYLASAGTVAAQAAAITAQVSFAPVNATANVPDFAQLSDTTPVSGSLFPSCLMSNTLLGNGVLGTAYSQSVMPYGGVVPYMVTLRSGSLPPGLSLNTSTGSITGTPSGTTAGTYPFTIGVTDSSGQSISQSYSVQIFPPVSISPAATLAGAVGESYPGHFSAAGGFGSYTWSVASGSLPVGLVLNTGTGALSGTPSATGTYSFTIQVLDSSGSTAQRQFSITINPALTFTSTAITPVIVGRAVNMSLTASGGASSYIWSITSGASALAAEGLSFSSAGQFTGTPVAATTGISLTIQVADSGTSVSKTLVLAINPPLSIPTPALPTATVNAPYSFSDPITSGYQPSGCIYYTGNFPTGIAPSGALVFSGTPTTAGTYNFTVRCSDYYNETATGTFTLTVNPVLSITTTTLPYGFLTVQYSGTIQTNGGGTGTGYTFSVASGSLPAGLSLNASTGAITGTPTTAGSSTFTIQVTDSGNNTASQQYTVAVYGLLTITTPSLPSGVAGFPYSQQLAATGGTGGNVWTISSGSLPAPLMLNSSTGVISGTPTSASTTPLSIKVTDSNTDTATASRTLTIVAPVSITTTSLPQGTFGVAYNQTIAVTGGVAPLTYSLGSQGTLPPGLSLNSSTGAITGSPTTPGAYNFTLSVTDSSGYQDGATQNYRITVTGSNGTLSITTTSLAPGNAGQAYSATLMATGGSGSAANYTWSATGLPSGLTLTPAGVLQGMPAAAGTTTNISVTVKDSVVQQTASQTYSLTIYAPISLDFVDAVSASQPLAYFRLNAPGGPDQTGQYTYMDSETGTAVMTPGAPVTGSSVAYTAFDGSTGAVSTSLSGGITNAGSLMAWVNLSALPSTQSTFSYIAGESQVGNDLDLQFTTSNSLGFYTTNNGQYLGYTPNPNTLVNQWHMIVVTFDNTAGQRAIYWDGNLVASDTTQSIPNKTAPFQIGATNVFTGRNFPGGIEEVALWNYALTQAQVSQLRDLSTVLPPAVKGAPYGPVTIGASGGSGTFIYTAAPLPAGLTIGTNGSISGTPAATGATAPITVTATDTGTKAMVSQNAFSLTVYQPLTITSVLPTPMPGIAYSQTAMAAGGSGTGYYWTISQGALPSGLSLAPSSGVISGTASAGTYTFTLQVSDSVGLIAIQNVTFNVGTASAPAITNTSLPGGVAGQPYGPVKLNATGGSGSYSFTATGLPSGVLLAASGTLSGTPAAAGTYPVSITVTDTSTQLTGHAMLILVVSSPPVTILPTPLTISSSSSFIGVALGGSVSASFSASGGTPPYSFTASGLPPGVSIGSTGLLTGSPSQAGSFTATAQVTDSQGSTALTTVTISVLGLTSTSLPAGTVGQFYSASLSATGGTAPYTFTGTGVPAGLTLSPAGSLTGTATAPGTYSIAIKVSDSAGLTISGTASVTFSGAKSFSISGAALPAGTVNTPYSQTLSASGGFAPYTWAVNSGTLPAGLSLSPSGTLSGVPSTPGSFTFGVMATDTSGAITTATETVTIQAMPITVTTQSLPSGVVGIGYPQQLLAATGGVMPYTWTGTLPAGLMLAANGSVTGVPTAAGSFPVTLTVTDQAGSKGTASFTLAIRPSYSTGLVLSVSSLNFSVLAPSAATPPAQQIGVQSTQAAQVLSYTAVATPAVPWLTLTNGSATPDTIQTSLNAAALTLAAGTYSTSISVACMSSGCAGTTQTVSVNLTVQTTAPQLGVGTDLLSFGASSSSTQSLVQSISISNAGGGSLGIASVTCEASWCQTSGVPGSLSGGMSASIPISINPALLTAGFFRTQVDIVSSAGRASVPVTVLLASSSSMVLAPAGQQFSQQAGSAPGNPSGSFLVTVAIGSAVSWTASVLPGAPWLVLNTPGGSSSATAPGSVTFSIDPVAAAALGPGAYYGRIEVAAGGIVDSPQDFEVVLSVAPASMPVIPDVEPAGLLFITTVGGAPPPQTVTVYSGSNTASGFQAGATTVNGSGWLSVTPNTGSASQGSPGVTMVSVNTAGLQPGVYRGGINYSLSATAVRQVNVTVIVTPPGTTGQLISGKQPDALSPKAGSCTPSQLVPAQTGLVNNFSAAVAWPIPLSVTLVNDCGSTVNTGQLVATFSNGDPPLPLVLADPTKALYSGTWTPRTAAAQMTVVAHASASGYPNATTQLQGAALPNAAPVLTPHGTLHSFDPLVGAALAPGTIIQIYGQYLATGTAQPTSIPLPTSMNGTSVLIGGAPAPLYFVSPGQINAQLPFELTAGNQYQILVTVNGALTTPDVIQLTPATPGLAAFADGTLIAQHSDGSLVSKTAPARPGEYLVAYLAGMGDTNATPASGMASPSSPLALPMVAPTLTINGTPEPIAFAGLTPGLVGLYQMNFQVPAGFPAGDLTLIVTQSGQPSNQTVLPYQP